jgi:hypothetical protein
VAPPAVAAAAAVAPPAVAAAALTAVAWLMLP